MEKQTRDNITLTGLLIALIVLPLGCGTQRKAAELSKNTVTAQLVLPKEKESFTPEVNFQKVKRDTLKIEDLTGKEVFVMKAVRDEDGEMVAADVLDAAVVTARFRNVAERHGKIDLEFQIIVPQSMQDSKWQLRFYPDMFILEDSLRLDPVIITGNAYRKAQLKGYQQYQRFIDSIISDTTKFINYWQLEIYIERNFPAIYAFSKDSTEVSDEQFYSVYGVSEREAIDHYTDKFAKARNNRKIARKGKMFRKYVKSPIITEGIRLDTVIQTINGDFVYNYIQPVNTRPKLRKVDIVLQGEIFEQDKKIYDIPKSEPLTFYISSLSAFVDNTERFLTKTIFRKAEANTACYVGFASGKDNIDLSIGNNAEEIGRIKRNLADLMENATYDLDSIIVTASASPEGSKALNDKLSARRAESIGRFLNGYIKSYQDSLERAAGFSIDEEGRVTRYKRTKVPFISRSGGENWRYLDRLVQQDTVMTDEQKEDYFFMASMKDIDARERKMQGEQWYRYMREHMYPLLRTVRFDFHLHRKDMVEETMVTTEPDTVYARGVQALRDRDYETAVTLLRPYNDYNTAVAYCAMDYNESALSILKTLEKTAQVNYMLAIIYSRRGDDQNAVQHYMHACQMEPSYIHRGNLDPEISTLIKRYGLNKQDDEVIDMSL